MLTRLLVLWQDTSSSSHVLEVTRDGADDLRDSRWLLAELRSASEDRDQRRVDWMTPQMMTMSAAVGVNHRESGVPGAGRDNR